MLRMLKAILAGTVVAAVVGGLYDYSRNGLADLTRGTAVEVWFSSTNTQYLMPWLFAIAGLIGAAMAALMLRSPGALALAGTAKQPTPRQAKQHGKAGGAAELAGMPGFDFDKAKEQIKAPAATTSIPPSYGAIPPLPAAPGALTGTAAPGVNEPPKEAQP